MRELKGFVFWDIHPDENPEKTPLFFKEGDTYGAPTLPITLFETAEEAGRVAYAYYQMFYEKNPRVEVGSAHFSIPNDREEEQRLAEESELVILHENALGNLNIIGAPTENPLTRYGNCEIMATRLTENNLIPYHTTRGETAFEIANEARIEISRQATQGGLTIVQLRLRRRADSKKLIYFQGK